MTYTSLEKNKVVVFIELLWIRVSDQNMSWKKQFSGPMSYHSMWYMGNISDKILGKCAILLLTTAGQKSKSPQECVWGQVS